MNITENQQRHIRSFVRREGRMTDRQQAALMNLWKKYGLSPDDPNALNAIFALNMPVILEIGFGMGQSLLAMAKMNPDTYYIGVEVHQPGVGALMACLEEDNIHNVKIYAIDAIRVLKDYIPPNSLSGLLIYFPDPWPKKRHHKRRLIQPDFICLAEQVLKSHAFLHCATDWEDYAYHMMSILSAASGLKNTVTMHQFSERPAWRPETKFERRGQGLGHHIYDLIFEKVNKGS